MTSTTELEQRIARSKRSLLLGVLYCLGLILFGMILFGLCIRPQGLPYLIHLLACGFLGGRCGAILSNIHLDKMALIRAKQREGSTDVN
jgi:hypothetical protein